MAKKKGMYLGGGGSSPASYDPDAYEEYDGGGAFAAGVRIVKCLLVGVGSLLGARSRSGMITSRPGRSWKSNQHRGEPSVQTGHKL